MPKKMILGLTTGRFVFVLASMPALVACGALTKQPWVETLLAVYSVVTLMCLSEGRRAGPACGVFYCLGYGALFFSKQIYGLAAFNTLFGAPVYLASLVAWGKHMSGRAVRPKKLTRRGWALSLGVGAASFAGVFLLLRAVGSQEALWDSLTLSLIGPGLVLLLLRYVENWVFNLAGSLVVLILWVINTMEDTANLSFVLIAALQAATNAIGLVTWLRLERRARDG
ncbi:MAG: nicotinamide riboside transporter PnuC [Oscillospiraceae bacterium]|jgi:nicotinamide mononucleotide transporter PnuC|nr:nicotinamide riboside transporter PnuC [Oscillospiraceae bacterium]